MKNARARLLEMITFIKSKYPAVARRLVIKITQRDLNDPSFHWYGATEDFNYSDIHPDIVKAFLSLKKIKKFVLPRGRAAREKALRKNPNREDRIMGFDHIRKFHDALLFGASERKSSMSPLYHVEMKKFLAQYKKEVAANRKTGNVDEYDSDPFSFQLVRQLASWFLYSGNIFCWFFLLMQWNCMARSINIDCIGFSNFKRGTDSIIVKYDETKADKAGENCHNKNLYANPSDPTVCLFVAFGLYCASESSSLALMRNLFLPLGSKIGRGAEKFCHHLGKIVEQYDDIVSSFIRCDRANSHGIRKGGSVHASSGTTCPPSLVSVALRGEWSMGKVFDIYFTFGEFGDHYLGRVLAGLDPNLASFSQLPPYFKEGIENLYIKRAMVGMFGAILQNHQGSSAILILCLASIVHHSEFIKDVIRNNPGHPLSTLFILQDEGLLQNLKLLVSTEISAVMQPTGIPPHVNQMIEIKNMWEALNSLTHKFDRQTEVIVAAVEGAIRANDVRSGVLNLATLEVRLFIILLYLILTSTKQQTRLTRHSQEVKDIINSALDSRGFRIAPEPVNNVRVTSEGMFTYGGKFWDVPEDFRFPAKLRVESAWRCWLVGLPNYEVNRNGVTHHIPIKPFRKLKLSRIPKKLQLWMRNEFIPFTKMMEKAPDLNLDCDTEIMDQFVNESFKIGIDYIKTRVEYIFRTQKWTSYTVGTFCKKLKHNEIMKNGSNADKRRSEENISHHNRHRRRRVT